LIDGVGVEIVNDVRTDVETETVTTTDVESDPAVAVIVDVPAVSPVTDPLFTVATAVSELVQVTEVVNGAPY
jgi:hypothetical protein